MGCEGEEAAGWHRNFASGGEKGGGVKSLVEENPGGGESERPPTACALS